MDKKKALINLGLTIILVILVGVSIYFLARENKKRAETKPEIQFRMIDYGSEVMQIGYTDKDSILETFIDSYNEKNGEDLVAIMDLVSTYIYSLCENPEKEFDDKYVEYMRVDSEIKTEEILIMQYSLQQQEKGLIESINNTNVQLSVIDSTPIENVSKYLSKFTAKIRTVSPDEGVDQEYILEFILLHNDDAYYVIDYIKTDA